MKYTAIIVVFFFSGYLKAATYSDIKYFDDVMSEIFVVCPELPSLSEPEITTIVSKIFSSRKFVPDEYIINFVLSAEDLPPAKLAKENHVGWYYTHDHKIQIWPNIEAKKRVLQLSRQ